MADEQHKQQCETVTTTTTACFMLLLLCFNCHCACVTTDELQQLQHYTVTTIIKRLIITKNIEQSV